jgi:PAS domain S-box-containing protein
MHPYALIPFIALLVASAFVAVSIVWDSHRRATGAMTEIFLCIAAWALIDLLAQLQTDPADAIFWLRLTHLPAFLLGVSVIRLVMELVPATAAQLAPIRRIGLVIVALIGLGLWTLPGVIDAATPTSWDGWIPHYGIVSKLLIPLGCMLPPIAAYQAWRATRTAPRESGVRIDRVRSRAIMAGVVVSVGASVATEYVYPLLAIPVPRLGALSAALATAITWIQLLHRIDVLSLAPQSTARAVLDELQDGVALVSIEGKIVTSNPRLTTIAGRSLASLVGMSLSRFVDVSFDSICEGVEDREYRLTTARGDRIPVSLSSSRVQGRAGETQWFVVVLRDLRRVDALRRRLLASGRLAAVGELAAGIAHEVNNPVAFIRSDLNFLRSRLAEIESEVGKDSDAGKKLDLLTEGSKRIDRALVGIERIAEVVGDVRGFAHVGSDASTGGDPEVVLESATRLARLERRDEVTLSVQRVAASTRVVAGQDLKQVLLALLRILTVNSRVGERVRVRPVVDAERLRIGMEADTMDDRAAKEVLRFKMARKDVLEASPENLGLAMAIELVDHMGGDVQITAPTPLALKVELSWPLDLDGRS